MVSRSWCVISFATDDFVLPVPDSDNGLRYGIAQLEICPRSQREHVQCYLEFSRTVRAAHVKSICQDNSLHVEKKSPDSTRQQARDYCCKEESRKPGATHQEVGVFESGGAGTRNDLVAVQQALDAGASSAMIAQEFFGQWVRYHRAFDLYRLTIAPQRDHIMDVHVYWGPTKTGKSHRAHHDNPGAYWLTESNGNTWFDGYNGQDVVVLDDFYGWLRWGFLLKLLDRYPMSVPVKSSTLSFVAKKIVFSSNKHPCDWYDYASGKYSYEALMRRITVCEEFTQVYEG